MQRHNGNKLIVSLVDMPPAHAPSIKRSHSEEPLIKIASREPLPAPFIASSLSDFALHRPRATSFISLSRYHTTPHTAYPMDQFTDVFATFAAVPVEPMTQEDVLVNEDTSVGYSGGYCVIA
ncbi:hypothetical protein MSAN_00494500 [Mycena sanguinolenta]|uniref:Uncharacterized protein n=1 Tax=Mycena sanguinolenta TaxID=230812 RepID=A0A8H7DHX5_9AGAR|nr:hypothetical protein MSAN_00494500 [Mycena sanguinolenta]